jgi:hypothetical protein
LTSDLTVRGKSVGVTNSATRSFLDALMFPVEPVETDTAAVVTMLVTHAVSQRRHRYSSPGASVRTTGAMTVGS